MSIGYGVSSQFAEQRFTDEADSPKWSAGVIGDANSVAAIRNSFYVYQYRDQVDASVSLYRLMISDTGNVGIGTTTPGKRLDITANLASDANDGLRIYGNNATYGPTLTLENAGSGGRKFLILSAGSGNVSGAGNFEIYDATAGGSASRFVINSTGNVGIGTTTPAYKLDIAQTGGTNFSGLRVASSGSGLAYVDISGDNADTGSGAILRLISRDVAGTGNVAVNLVKYANGTFVIGNAESNAAASIAFQIGAAERMRISSAGNLGIGTGAAGQRLTVYGPSGAAGLGSSNSGLAWFIENTGTNGLNIGVNYNGGSPYSWLQSQFAGGAAAYYTLLLNPMGGNVGIGTTAPQSALHVPDGKYAQFEDFNAGPPPTADCDSDTERGRQSIDTTNFRFYICMGATRGWDYAALTN